MKWRVARTATSRRFAPASNMCLLWSNGCGVSRRCAIGVWRRTLIAPSLRSRWRTFTFREVDLRHRYARNGRNTSEKPAQSARGAKERTGMTIFIGDSESLRMCHRDQLRLHGLISIFLSFFHHDCYLEVRTPRVKRPITASRPIGPTSSAGSRCCSGRWCSYLPNRCLLPRWRTPSGSCGTT